MTKRKGKISFPDNLPTLLSWLDRNENKTQKEIDKVVDEKSDEDTTPVIRLSTISSVLGIIIRSSIIILLLGGLVFFMMGMPYNQITQTDICEKGTGTVSADELSPQTEVVVQYVDESGENHRETVKEGESIRITADYMEIKLRFVDTIEYTLSSCNPA